MQERRPSIARAVAIALTLALTVVGTVGANAGQARAADENDLSTLDLSGAWYVLLHYKDAKSEDKSITKFKDFAWNIEQSDRKLVVEEYPYVVFDEGSEELRRFAMRSHKTWEPEGLVRSHLAKRVEVSSRAMRTKTLNGSAADGFKSLAPIATGGLTMSFSRNWKIEFGAKEVRVEIVDSLSGGDDMLGEMTEAIVFRITQRTADGELRGSYAEGDKSGTVRMIPARERRVIK